MLLAIMRMDHKGFTLIELLIVVAIIGILAAIAYISSVPRDPFTSNAAADWAQWGWAYDYVNNYGGNHDGGWGHMWRLNSWGPDTVNGWGGQRDGSCPNGYPDFLCQSTNGLTSKGDIVWVGPKDALTTSFCNIINGV